MQKVSKYSKELLEIFWAKKEKMYQLQSFLLKKQYFTFIFQKTQLCKSKKKLKKLRDIFFFFWPLCKVCSY